MKRIILLIMMVCTLAKSYGQNQRIYTFEGKFDYALIENTRIYIPIRPLQYGYSATISMNSLDTSSIVVRHFCSAPQKNNLPFSWYKAKENLYSVAFWRSSSGLSTRIYYRRFETRDSLEMESLPKDQEIQKKSLLLTPLDDYFKSFYKSRYIPDRKEMIAIENTLNFDIYAPTDNQLQFYLRDESAFYVWECSLPEKSSVTEWQEVIVYATPNLDKEYAPLKYSKSYTGIKTIFNSITDSLFFEGHFKVIAQNTQKFIVNRDHGSIYHFGGKRIVKIGSIIISDNYPKIKGKSLFIEDRDNKQLIFFAPIKWIRDDLPKPSVRIITDEHEFNEMFKYVLE